MISRQREWQIKKVKEGKCQICGKKQVIKWYCEKHRQLHNAYHKKSIERSGKL